MPGKKISYSYFLYGQRVKSDIPLGRLPVFKSRSADFVLRCPSLNRKEPGPKGRKRIPPLKIKRWYHRIRDPQGNLATSFARQGKHFLIRFHGTADFLISEKGRSIAVEPKRGSTLRDLQALFLTQTFPFVLSLAGFPVLHASAAKLNGGAAAFLGNQDYGKSTFSAACYQAGLPILTDDSLILYRRGNKIMASPSFPEIRISPKAVRYFMRSYDGAQNGETASKIRVRIDDNYVERPIPLKAIYWIKRSSRSKNQKIQMDRLSARDAWFRLIENSFRLDLQNRNKLKKEVDFFSQVVSLVPVKRLKFPRGFQHLPGVIQKIQADLIA